MPRSTGCPPISAWRCPTGYRPSWRRLPPLDLYALQGVRQAGAQIGDTACVIGLGLVGQLVVQLLVASGVQVVGLDPDQNRCRLAEKAGSLVCAAPTEEGVAALERAPQGLRGPRRRSDFPCFRWLLQPARGAGRPASPRDRAMVVDIGKCNLDLPWNDYYEKELELRFSRSYGPGRYDPTYEIDGIDYPAGYVRWTERRNLHCFVNALATKEVDPQSLIAGIYPLAEAPSVYRQLNDGSLPGVAFLFEYDASKEVEPAVARSALGPTLPAPGLDAITTPRRAVVSPGARNPGALRVGFVGAGNYASSMLLPHLAKDPRVDLVRVATRRSLSAVNAQRKFEFETSGTDAEAVIEDPSLDAIFIVTRHSSHAELTCRALKAGKAVFVEKPLALTGEELDRVLDTVDATGNDRILVGFNRRYSPLLVEMRARFGNSSEPMSARYLVNAGRLGSGSWYEDGNAEGSRFVGEGGHFIDTLSWWIGSSPVEVVTMPVAGSDEVQMSLRYNDGSFATITYITNAHRRFPKETLEISTSGRTARLDNFRRATVWSGTRALSAGSWPRRTRARPLRSGRFSTQYAAVGRCLSL